MLSDERTRIKSVVLELATRIEAICVSDANISPTHWRASGIGGNSGLALLFAACGRASLPGSWGQACYRQLAVATTDGNAPIGLHSGLGGLLFASRESSSVVGESVRRLCLEIEGVISDCISRDQLIVRKPTSSVDFDLISGLAGVRIALDAESALTAEIDRYLVALGSDVSFELWATPIFGQETLGDDWRNLGMAHGIAGVLAALSVYAPAQASGARAAVGYLLRHQTAAGIWPAAVREGGVLPGRQAWCYGGPGCSAALVLYGKAACADDLVRKGLDALHAFLDYRREHWHIDDYALCHGLAGIAITLHSIGHLVNDAKLKRAAERLALEVTGAFDASLPFGYAAVTDQSPAVDDPSFLTGATGIALALGTIAGLFDSSWCRCLGLV